MSYIAGNVELCVKDIQFSTSRQMTQLFDVHESVHRDTIMKVTNKMQLYRLIYYS